MYKMLGFENYILLCSERYPLKGWLVQFTMYVDFILLLVYLLKAFCLCSWFSIPKQLSFKLHVRYSCVHLNYVDHDLVEK